MSEIPKAYEPQSVEDKWYDFWLKQGCFTADPARVTDRRPAYSIVIPPPNVTGMLHMGHVLNNTIQDILSRKARMDGKEVLWLPGTDHAGIATEGMVSKQIWKEEKKSKRDIGREEFIKRVWQWKEKHGGIIISQLKKLGCSCDWTRERFTMDPDYVRNVQRVFVDLYKKGLIYRGKRMVNWCPATQTALSDEEVEMKPQKGVMYHFKVQVADFPGSAGVPPASSSETTQHAGGTPALPGSDGRIWLTIATTRPETIPGDTAVAVNPKDTRYAHLIGKHIVRPLPPELPREQKLIPIIGDEHVDFEFGTGVLKVTPAHDKADFEIGQRHKLPIVDIMNPDATMNELAGADLKGLDRFKARKVAVEKLTELGALVEEKPYENNVGFSQRADVPIEPRLSEQWFLKYPAVEQSKACVEQRSALEKQVQIVIATGQELRGKSIKELRRAATAFAKGHGIIGQSFKNADSGIEIRVGRQSLTHAFSNLGVANIKAVVVLPQLIQNSVWLSSEPHDPPNPMFKQVHRFVAALSLGGELHRVLITAKEFWDGTILYDHKAKKITLGGKSLEAHPREGKLDTQPAPSAGVKVGDLLEDVNIGKMRFHPQRWAKVYDHWLTNIQDWCISRQLWWGHRIPVWTKRVLKTEDSKCHLPLLKAVFATWKEDDDGISEMTAELSSVPGALTFLKWRSEKTDNFVLVNAATDSPAEAKVLESDGFTQDPDVLDTWFSSWLWPFATMGWTDDKSLDSKNPTLQAFYPTTDLVTGPDIIFFWVARMIMAGYEFMGDLPFRNVYFTGIIRDKQGRKMSKTLGNSPDPLVLIAQYGADALRFGTMRSAPLGQDVLFDEKDVELGRNFCNKLWNACRFRQMQSSAGVLPAPGRGKTEGRRDACPTFEGEIKPTLLTSDDKWILLRLDQAIREVSEGLATYNFSIAVQTLYRFFWSEYCDWYVEASKAAFMGSSRRESAPSSAGSPASESGLTSAATGALAANKLAVMDFVLGHTLRLFHPFLPFITEELWQGMGFSQDMPEDQGGKTIMTAPWPKPFTDEEKEYFSLDDAADQVAVAKYELVSLGRSLRRDSKIDPAKKVKFVLRPAGELAAAEIEVIKILLNAETVDVVGKGWTPDKGTPSAANALGELFLPLAGLVDFAAERTRLEKELAKADAEIEKVQAKLANPSFTQKVPAKVLEEHQHRLADWQSKRAQIQKSLEALG